MVEEGRGREFILMFFHFIQKRGTAAPSKEGRGRKHHPKEADGDQSFRVCQVFVATLKVAKNKKMLTGSLKTLFLYLL